MSRCDVEALPQQVDVLVVGAGQAGLGAAYRLTGAPALRVLVVDRGRVVQRGSHRELLSRPGPYARLHASWRAQAGT